jgi:hypothetical protein
VVIEGLLCYNTRVWREPSVSEENWAVSKLHGVIIWKPIFLNAKLVNPSLFLWAFHRELQIKDMLHELGPLLVLTHEPISCIQFLKYVLTLASFKKAENLVQGAYRKCLLNTLCNFLNLNDQQKSTLIIDSKVMCNTDTILQTFSGRF